jgi:hypothetical protein
VDEDGNTRVYRNEDTGFLWPPYFKFDSEDLQTEARTSPRVPTTPQWVSITHYGWRMNVFSDLSECGDDQSRRGAGRVGSSRGSTS